MECKILTGDGIVVLGLCISIATRIDGEGGACKRGLCFLDEETNANERLIDYNYKEAHL